MKRISRHFAKPRGIRVAWITATVLALGIISPSALSANTPNNYTGSTTGNLSTTTNWSLGHVPLVGEDATFSNGTGIRHLDASSLTVGSLDVTDTSHTYTIRNTSTGNSTLTLGGSGDNGNSVSGTVSTDLLYAATGSTLTLTGNNGGDLLNVVLGQSGTFDAAGTINVSSAISDGGNNYKITANGAGTLVLSGANTFGGGLVAAGGEVDVSADNNLGVAGGSITINGGRLGIMTNSFTVDSTRGVFLGANPTGGNNTGTLSIKGSITTTFNQGFQNLNVSTVGDLVKQGGGTLVLGGASTYSGSTFLNNGITQLTAADNRLPTGTTVYLGQLAGTSSANAGTLNLNGFNQQVAGLNSTSSGSATIVPTTKNTVTNSGASIVTLTLGGSGTYAYGDGTAMNSGVLTGALSVNKTGTGTQTFGDANTYTGSTTVSAGTLIAGTATTPAAMALGGTSGVFVNNGGTLQMGAANQFNATTPAPLNLSGAAAGAATFSVNGNSQGSTTVNGVGALTLTAASVNNVIDFNSKNGVVTFASFVPNGAALTINNYVNNSGAAGGPDELIFNQDQGPNGSNDLGSFVFTGYGAATEAALGNGFYEVFPTAVPEPTTLLGGMVLVAAVGWRQRRRLRALAGTMCKARLA